MIPAAHALRASLALKLWALERKHHVMSLVTDEGLALFSGLNVTPKKSYLSEYASRIAPRTTTAVLAAWHGMRSTLPLVARRGLALRLGERSAGHLDPGAVSCFVLLAAIVPRRRS